MADLVKLASPDLTTQQKTAIEKYVRAVVGQLGAFGIDLFSGAGTAAIPAIVNRVRTSGYTSADVGAADYVYDAAVNSAYIASNPLTSFLASDGRGFRLSTHQDVTSYMFGAIDGTDVKTALEAWGTFIWGAACSSASSFVSGTSALPISIGSAAGCQTARVFFGGSINATATMDVLLTITNPSRLEFSIGLWGSSSTSTGQAWASRSAGYGLRVFDVQNRNILGKITCNNFKFWGVLLNDAIAVNGNNSNYGALPYIRGNSCGISNAVGGTSAMSATWSSPTRLGTSGSTAQTTTLIVSAAPTVDAVMATWGWLFWIAGYPYAVKSMADNGDGTYTLTLYEPWIDDTSLAAGSGTGHYTVGGVCCVRGSDSNVVPLDAVFGTNCGYLFMDNTAYGATVRRLASDGKCDVLFAFGQFTNAIHYGGGFEVLYIEGTTESAQILSVGPTSSERVRIGRTTGQEINFGKWFKLAPRSNVGTDSGNLYYQGMTELSHVEGYDGKTIVAQYGCDFTTTWDPGSCANGTPVTTTINIPASLSNGWPLRVKFSQGLQGLILTAYPSNTSPITKSTVTIQLSNPSTAAAVDLASGTATVTLLQ